MNLGAASPQLGMRVVQLTARNPTLQEPGSEAVLDNQLPTDHRYCESQSGSPYPAQTCPTYSKPYRGGLLG